jgi:hypothetical protein
MKKMIDKYLQIKPVADDPTLGYTLWLKVGVQSFQITSCQWDTLAEAEWMRDRAREALLSLLAQESGVQRERELADVIEELRVANRRLQAQGEELERDKVIVGLRAEIGGLQSVLAADAEVYGRARAEVDSLRATIARLSQCGLCGNKETPDNAIFICCQDCSHLGHSEVPREVFELQRQREEARAELADKAARCERLETALGHYVADEMWDGNYYRGWQDARYVAQEALAAAGAENQK